MKRFFFLIGMLGVVFMFAGCNTQSPQSVSANANEVRQADVWAILEAEDAQLSGGAKKNTNHAGYTGTGFVDGFWNVGAQVSFPINSSYWPGIFQVTIRYAAASTSTNVGLYVDGFKVKNLTFNGLGSWDTWGTITEYFYHTAQGNITLKTETSGNCINLDNITYDGPLTDYCQVGDAQGGGNGLRGTVFGLNPPFFESDYCRATDGNTGTFYDFCQADGGYTGLDLGAARRIGKIRYYPRANLPSRMNGGKFQGSNMRNFGTFADLFTITATPNEQWNEVTVSNSGEYRYVRYLSPNGGYGNIAEVEFYAATNIPYNGPHYVANGSTLQFENFDNGGEGVAYHDNDVSNNGGAYRTGVGVDIEGCSAGGYNVGWIAAGEWMKYTCKVIGGTYDVTLYYSSPNSVKFILTQDNGSSIATFVGPSTGGWQNWRTVTITNVPFNGGFTSELKFLAAMDGFNVDKVTFVAR